MFFRPHADKSNNAVAKDRQNSLRICTDINRILMNVLSTSTPHLNEAEYDIEPRHEAFWFVGGIEAPLTLQRIRKGHDFHKQYEKEPIDRPFQYAGYYD